MNHDGDLKPGYYYTDADREDAPHALPVIEIFWSDANKLEALGEHESGWFYWYCFPGCLPDSDPEGPYASVRDALAAARLT